MCHEIYVFKFSQFTETCVLKIFPHGFSSICGNISLFISNFINLGFLFFLISLVRVCDSYLFKEPALCFTDPLHCFLLFNSLIPTWIFIISSHLLILGLIYSCFLKIFRFIIRLFIWYLSDFLMQAFIVINFHLKTTFIISQRFWLVVFSFLFDSMKFLIPPQYL
jgi:hypothetical protein